MRSRMETSPLVLASIAVIAVGLCAVSCPARAQDGEAGSPPAEVPPEPAPAEGPAEGPATPAGDEPEELEAEQATEDEPELEPLPPPPPDRTLELGEQPAPPTEEPTGEPSIRAYEETLEPTLVLPEFRIRLGGGVSLATSGPSGVWGRTTQEAEWLPPSLQFLSIGIGAAQIYNVGVAAQVGARVGGYAWFCEDPVVRCMGAITIQVGAIFGAIGPDFDFAADADLRFLFSKIVELHVRGGFFSVQMQSFVNITGGVGFAF